MIFCNDKTEVESLQGYLKIKIFHPDRAKGPLTFLLYTCVHKIQIIYLSFRSEDIFCNIRTF